MTELQILPEPDAAEARNRRSCAGKTPSCFVFGLLARWGVEMLVLVGMFYECVEISASCGACHRAVLETAGKWGVLLFFCLFGLFFPSKFFLSQS